MELNTILNNKTMANKTAMQEMYGDLIEKHIVYTKAGMINEATSLVSSIELAEHLIGKEKEQIMDAYSEGFETGYLLANGEDSKFEGREQYYNKIYGK